MSTATDGITREAGMLRRWTPSDTPSLDSPAVRSLARDLRLPPIVAALLIGRGIQDGTTADRFLQPRLSHLHDPRTMPGCDAAAQRILRAIAQQQPIVIYGDYDVDGVTASAILWHMLTALGAKVHTYVPHRIDEGYGLNSDALRHFAQGRVVQPDGSVIELDRQPLVVTVDCGITALEPATVARAVKLELIITDHHERAAAGLPDVDVLVHPRVDVAGGPGYPFGDLCGAGVAFKLAWHTARLHAGSERLPDDLRALLLDLMSLAALGTVADVVPLVDENRVLTIFGLGQIKRTRFAGLNAMIDQARLREEKIDAFHVGFVLGPRLNACGRMGHAAEALRLLTTAQGDDAVGIARFLTRVNEERRSTEREIFELARSMVREQGFDREDCRAIVVGGAGWHPGVVGIVASRLVDAFCRPAVVLNIDNGEAHGSARSVEGLPMHLALEHCTDLLNTHGGHAMAAGMRLNADRLDVFRERLVGYCNQHLGPEDLVGLLRFDGECRLQDLSVPLFEQVLRLAPFGRGNTAPRLCLRGVTLDRPAQRIGREGMHMRLMLRDGDHAAQAVAFGLGDLCEKLPGGSHIDLIFEPKLSTWQGRTRIDMFVEDVRLR